MTRTITQVIHYTESHALTDMHALTITLERNPGAMWEGVVYLHNVGMVPTSGLQMYVFSLPLHEQLNDVLMQVRARLELKFETLSTRVTESMRGAEHA